MLKKWMIKHPNPLIVEKLEAAGYPRLLSVLLANRNIEAEQAEKFLTEDCEWHDPFLLKDMDRAVQRIQTAIEKKQKIMIYGDYDTDGITSTVTLSRYFESKGVSVMHYLPDRFKDGYGLNMPAMERIAKSDVDLLITVDNGIAAAKEIEYGNAHGIDTIVTDHHNVPAVIPTAVAVIDAKRPDSEYPFRELCGCGVVFKLICALEQKNEICADDLFDQYGYTVCLGTVADIVPLVEENRKIVHRGIPLIELSNMDALFEEVNLAYAKITSTELAFRIVPKINASGRIESAETAYQYFMDGTKDVAEKLITLNEKRQEIQTKIFQEAVKAIDKDERYQAEPVIVAYGDHWHEGVIGIVASQLVERYGKPAIVISVSENKAKGSCRSVEGFDMYDALSHCANTLKGFGGHKMAAGLSLPAKNIPVFRKVINDFAKSLPKMPTLSLNVECELKDSEINMETVRLCSQIEPFGEANPSPVFLIRAARIQHIKMIKDGQHLKLSLHKKDIDFNAMLFNVMDKGLYLEEGDVVDIAVELGENTYNCFTYLSVVIDDIRLSTAFEDKWKEYRQIKETNPGNLKTVFPSRDELNTTYRAMHDFWMNNKSDKSTVTVRCFRLYNTIQSMCETVGFTKMLVILDIFHDAELMRFSIYSDKIRYGMMRTRKTNLQETKTFQLIAGTV